jgi:HAD superfamily hydrolase (TIGR01509 family)
MIRAVIFDFDGLILDTEKAIFKSWQETYQEYQCHLSFEDWSKIIGTADLIFDPFAELERQFGCPLDRNGIIKRQIQRESELIDVLAPLPGVREALQEGKQMGVKIGLASSSNCAWVTGHLTRLDLIQYFDCLIASDDVIYTKPSPELYLKVMNELHLEAGEAIVFEDSPNGILAARRAGLFCVAIPSTLTSRMDTSLADLRLNSLQEMPLKNIIALVEAQQAA